MRSTDDVGSGGPRRHARVWLDAATWRSHLLSELDEATAIAVDDWIARGRAVVARRRDPMSASSRESSSESSHSFDDDRACFVAVVLPPSAGKRRVGMVVDARAVVRVASPLTLDDAIARAPVTWRSALIDLVRRGRDIDTRFHVYGSLAWQAISGETYVGPTSDVDLLWSADGSDRIRRVLCVLIDWEAAHGLRADGELVLANGDGLAWRELLGDARRVLVKHRDRVSLQPSPLCSSLQTSSRSSSGSSSDGPLPATTLPPSSPRPADRSLPPRRSTPELSSPRASPTRSPPGPASDAAVGASSA